MGRTIVTLTVLAVALIAINAQALAQRLVEHRQAAGAIAEGLMREHCWPAAPSLSMSGTT